MALSEVHIALWRERFFDLFSLRTGCLLRNPLNHFLPADFVVGEKPWMLFLLAY